VTGTVPTTGEGEQGSKGGGMGMGRKEGKRRERMGMLCSFKLFLGKIPVNVDVCLMSVDTQLLSKPKYSGVEKIKTIGSTYMAAAGLLRHMTNRKV